MKLNLLIILIFSVLASCSVIQKNGYYQSRSYKLKHHKTSSFKKNKEAVNQEYLLQHIPSHHELEFSVKEKPSATKIITIKPEFKFLDETTYPQKKEKSFNQKSAELIRLVSEDSAKAKMNPNLKRGIWLGLLSALIISAQPTVPLAAGILIVLAGIVAGVFAFRSISKAIEAKRVKNESVEGEKRVLHHKTLQGFLALVTVLWFSLLTAVIYSGFILFTGDLVLVLLSSIGIFIFTVLAAMWFLDGLKGSKEKPERYKGLGLTLFTLALSIFAMAAEIMLGIAFFLY